MKNFILFILVLLFNVMCFSVCPESDLTGDCRVDLDDVSVLALGWQDGFFLSDLTVLASEWLEKGVSINPSNMAWVSVNDPGVAGYYGFDGDISKFEVTNAKYCTYLNATFGSSTKFYYGDVYGHRGEFHNLQLLDLDASDCQIQYVGGAFIPKERDGYSMADHPVVRVSWYGAKAFCDYYGYRLPTQWEWQAVADYDGNFVYGCGVTIDDKKANYGFYNGNPLGLTSYPFTSPVDYYPAYGYGLHGMAANVSEWTSSWTPTHYAIICRGGNWQSYSNNCKNSGSLLYGPLSPSNLIGFRVCRGNERAVPDVAGLSQAEAETAIVAAHFQVRDVIQIISDTVPAGDVAYQIPSVGETLPPEGEIDLVISAGASVSLIDMAWVTITDSGAGMKDRYGSPISHGGFSGQMSRYETTNAQYCQYLNAVLALGYIRVEDYKVYSVSSAGQGSFYSETFLSDQHSQIIYIGGEFHVLMRDGYDMSNHPVVMVSWIGASAFCGHYGYYLPTEWQWQAVADYDGSFVYGCGVTIDHATANYDNDNPLGLSGEPFTVPVDYYPASGYGMYGMAGNIVEVTDSIQALGRIFRGGNYSSSTTNCSVAVGGYTNSAASAYKTMGFRACR